MARRHPGVPADTACIWPTTNNLFDEMSQRLICWAGAQNVYISTYITQHFHARKDLCTMFGALTFTDSGTDMCPLPDDLDISAADPIDPVTCIDGITIPGNLIIDGGLVINQPDASTVGLRINQPNPVTSADANMIELWYQTFNTMRANELGLPRDLTPPATTGLGKEGEATHQFHAGTPTSKSSRWFHSNGTEVGYVLGNGTATFTGPVLGPNLYESLWTPITIDSPQTAAKYTANANGANNTNSPQVMIIAGGKRALLRGRINSVTTGGVTDEIIATTVPTSITVGTATISSVPLQDRGFVAMGSGGGIRIIIRKNGNIQMLGAANTQPYIMLDGIEYSLET